MLTAAVALLQARGDLPDRGGVGRRTPLGFGPVTLHPAVHSGLVVVHEVAATQHGAALVPDDHFVSQQTVGAPRRHDDVRSGHGEPLVDDRGVGEGLV